MKKIISIFLCILIALSLISCDSSSKEPNDINTPDNGIEENNKGPEIVEEDKENIQYEYTEEGIIKPEIAEKIISNTSQEVIMALKDKDMEKLSGYVHPVKGVRFTPYTYVSLESDVVFTKEEIKGFFEDDRKILWGYYDGSGEDILLTPREYYDRFVYSEDFANAEEIGYNTVLSFGNALENQFEVYENPIVVEYYFPGFTPEYDGLDWRSLRLVFEEYNNKWYLVGIINNEWTI